MRITKLFTDINCSNCNGVASQMELLNDRGFFEDYRPFEVNRDGLGPFQMYDVQKVPTILIFENGQLTERYDGEQTSNFLSQFFNTATFEGDDTPVPSGTTPGTTSTTVMNNDPVTNPSIPNNVPGTTDAAPAVSQTAIGIGLLALIFVLGTRRRNR